MTLPRNHTCICSPTSLNPLPPSYQFQGTCVWYALEVTGRYEQKTDKKGKGKWNLFGDKMRMEKITIPFQVETDSVYDPELPSPPPLAPEATYRTYPISQESVEGRKRITLVELKEPKEIGLLVAKVKSVKLLLELTSQTHPRSFPPTILPSFRYTLLASLGRYPSSAIPLVTSSLSIASASAQFSLHKSTTLDSPTGSKSRQNIKQPLLLVHRDEKRRRRRIVPRPLDVVPARGGGETTTIDHAYEVTVGEDEEESVRRGKGSEGMREVWVKFEGEFEVISTADEGVKDANDEKRLVPIRTCHYEVRYDLTATFSFGTSGEEDYNALAQLKSTNLPLHLDSTRGYPRREAKDELDEAKTIQDASPSSPLASTSQPLPPSMTTSQRAEDLPAYDPSLESSSNPTTNDEKRGLSSMEQPEQIEASASSHPPAYSGEVARARGTATNQGEGRRETEGEEPPTWEETVRDDMIDDWVAASVALGATE